METSNSAEQVEDVGHEEKIDAAFLNSENHALNGVKLQPYSPARVMAAQAMEIHYGYVDPSGVERFRQTGMYPGQLGDAAIVLWLCSLEKDDEIDLAFRQPTLARKKAFDWAGEQGILDPKSEQSQKAQDLFLTIMQEVAASKFTAEKKSPTMTESAEAAIQT